jgi:hypothetical protein
VQAGSTQHTHTHTPHVDYTLNDSKASTNLYSTQMRMQNQLQSTIAGMEAAQQQALNMRTLLLRQGRSLHS